MARTDGNIPCIFTPSQTGYFGHQTTCVVAIPRMCKTRLLTFPKCFEMLTRFGFRGKMYYLCISKVERALNKRVFSSFFAKKNGIFTSEINFFTLLRNFFLGVCGFFLRNVDGFLGDEERLKVKRYLFSWPHFL